MTKLSTDYPEIERATAAIDRATEIAREIGTLAPHRRQTWRNVLTLAAMTGVCLVIAGVVVGVGGAIAWIVGAAVVRALS